MINKFTEYLNESLAAQMMTEPSSETAVMAKKMSLTYVGFGRYADKSGKIKYIVKNNQLYPFKGKDIEQGNIDNLEAQMDNASVKDDVEASQVLNKKHKTSLMAIKADEVIKNKYKKQNIKLINSYDKQLKSLYLPSLFNEDEYNALNAYVNQDASNINRYLYKGFDIDTTPDQANQIVQLVQNLDNAFEEAGAPFEYTVYTGLSSRYDFNKIKPNNDYVFRGYISTSLNHDIITNMLDFDQTQPVGTVLEIDIKKGQKSIYTDGLFGDQMKNYETLLPRGTKVKVLGGPFMLDGDISTVGSSGKQIALFKCSIAEE